MNNQLIRFCFKEFFFLFFGSTVLFCFVVSKKKRKRRKSCVSFSDRRKENQPFDS